MRIEVENINRYCSECFQLKEECERINPLWLLVFEHGMVMELCRDCLEKLNRMISEELEK